MQLNHKVAETQLETHHNHKQIIERNNLWAYETDSDFCNVPLS